LRAGCLARPAVRGYIKLGQGYKSKQMAGARDKHAKIRLGRHSVRLPGNRRQRVILGAGLVAGGVVGFLPIVGFWMLPLGLAVLSVDSPRVRRLRRRVEVRWSKWRHSRCPEKERAGSKPGPKALGNGGVSSREDERENAVIRLTNP
jgi:hypothetical protein